MLLYLDADVRAKRYVIEAGSSTVVAVTDQALAVATSILSRAETVAALGNGGSLARLRSPI